jgi:hypothetical protein
MSNEEDAVIEASEEVPEETSEPVKGPQARVGPDDMAVLNNAKLRVQLAVSRAEKAGADARIADLEYRSLVQQVFIKYGLKTTDRIDEQTGVITKAEEEESK